MKYQAEEELLPSSVRSENFTLRASATGENIPVAQVEYYKGDNTLYIYPEYLKDRNAGYFLSASSLILSDGGEASLSGVRLEPQVEWEADPYSVSVLYSSYKKNGVYLYKTEGQTDFSVEFQIVNTSKEAKNGVSYTIFPSGDQNIVFAAGTLDIPAGESVTVSAMVKDYIMGKGETVEIEIG